MRTVKLVVYSFLLVALAALTACVSADLEATETPQHADTTPQMTPTLQPPSSPVDSTPPSPTATNDITPTSTEQPSTGEAPSDWEGVLTWLTAHWQADPTAVNDTIDALDEAGWIDKSIQQSSGSIVEFQLVDLSGDTIPEWVITLHPPTASPLSTPRGERWPGNIVIIGDEGVVSQVYAGAPPIDRIAPLYIGVADLTDDGLDELILETLTCGANTCYGKYNIMSYHLGYLDDIATADMQDRVNPRTRIPVEIVEVNEPIEGFYLEYTDGDNMTGIRKLVEWAWQNGTFEQIRLEVFDGRIPTNLTELETWLTRFYLDMESRRGSAQEWLYAGRWMSGLMEIVAADMDGDGENEWIVPYYLPNAPVQEIPGFHPVQPGGLWIVNSSGVVHKAEDHLRLIPGAPKQAGSIGILDMTGDGRLDVLIEGLVCGPDYCSGSYELLSGHNGPVRNLLAEDHELSISSRINPTATIIEPGNVQIVYETRDGDPGNDNWFWDSETETLFRLTGDAGACSIAVNEGVNTYMRPSTEAAVFSTVGYTAAPEMRTADGWLGFDPGVAQAGNVGVFRMRWVQESEATVTGDCATLPVVVGPQPGVCYAMIYIDTPVHEMPDVGTAVIANLNPEDFVSVTGRNGDDWLQIDANGSDPGWVTFAAAGLNGPCEDLPESG